MVQKLNFSIPRGRLGKGTLCLLIFFIFLNGISLKFYSYQVDIVNWVPITHTPKGPLISHLFYKDDLTFMATMSHKTISNMHHCLNLLCTLYGKTINQMKSKAIFYEHCPAIFPNLLKTYLV